MTASRVLAVDDSATIRKALQLILEPAGFNVEFGATGQEAIDKTKQSLPEVLLLDFILPDMRGTDVCRVLAADANTAGIPIILISTKGAEIRQAYQDLDNVVHYIAKPFAPDEVTQAISDVLSQSRESRMAKLRARDAATAPASITGASVSAAVTKQSEPAVARDSWQPAADDVAGGVPGEGWEDGDGGVSDDEVEIAVANRVRDVTRRETLDVMFESLRSGLEGVYVEEVDTPGGAAADEAKSYTDLASALAQQLAETLAQAQTGAQFGLCSDGSIRSLDDTLHDTFRRVSRLLFRAVGAGAVENQMVSPTRPRVLVVCRADGDVWERLALLKAERSDWHVFAVCADVRQLAIMTRMYGPHHMVVDGAYGSALWDQLKVIRALPEGQRLHILGIVQAREDVDAAGARPAADTLAALGVDVVEDPGHGLLHSVCARIERPGSTAAVAPSPDLFAPAAHG